MWWFVCVCVLRSDVVVWCWCVCVIGSPPSQGKDVAVLLEGRARFDELQNLYWRLHFESSGVKILPLVPNYKVHAKVLSVRHQVRRIFNCDLGIDRIY